MHDTIIDPSELLRELQLDEQQVGLSREAAQQFQLRVPRSLLRRMQPGNPDDPLLRQVLPSAEELKPDPALRKDAVGDLNSANETGILHKYQGRALLITTGSCAVNCRYCFRRHFPYREHNAGRKNWETSLAHVGADKSLHEIILSGGDPLTLGDRRLIDLIEKLDRIPHLDTLRIHTRVPVVQPENVSDRLVEVLANLRMQAVMVIHANHANELDAHCAASMEKLRNAGVTLLNQSVLLRGVNNDVATLEALSRRLLQISVLPYYLHISDPVTGTGHFRVSKENAIQLMEELGARLPGYLMPRLASEEPGRLAKTHHGWTPGRIGSPRGME